MRTPIFDFVSAYAATDTTRLHMPGHKGVGALGVEKYDITEIKGADALYHADGIIAESERYAAELFRSRKTFYSVEGSTLAIKAMLATALVLRGSRSRTLIAARGAHKSLIYAAGELDFNIEWIYPDEGEHFLSCTVTPQKLEAAISRAGAPFAVYLTSPDYLGRLADIKSIAEVCNKYSLPLLVDNAHGAYLAFLENSLHPIALGAAMCADSAHKTLPVITGGAYLHISESADDEMCECAQNMLSAFASTSPSYLILSSLDLCNKSLSDGYNEKIIATVDKIGKLKESILAIGVPVVSGEPMKITLAPNVFGYTGEELADTLRAFGIEPEYADGQHTVLMPSAENSDSDFDKILSAIKSLVRRAAIKTVAPRLVRPLSAISPKEAIFSRSELLPLSDAVGRICAVPTVACPPAVPIVVSGEIIDAECAEVLSLYGVEKIRVVK